MADVKNNILEGHYSCETKVKRPAMTVADAPVVLPKHALFSEKEAKQKIKSKKSPNIIKIALKSILDFVIAASAGVAATAISSKLNGFI